MKRLDFIELWVLNDFDGSDGRYNRSAGYVTNSMDCAEEWLKKGFGRSHTRFEGVLIESMSDLEDAEILVRRQKALAKLTEDDKRILGLI